MMRRRFASLLVATSLVAAASAHAQTNGQVNVTLTGAQGPDGQALIANFYYISPYTGTISPATVPATKLNTVTVALNCVDFYHDVTIGESWVANDNDIGTLMNMENGTPGQQAQATADLALTRYDNLTLYEQMAYLTTFYQTDNNNVQEADAIQTAIWWLAADESHAIPPTPNPTVVEGDTNLGDTSNLDTGYWINLAEKTAPTNASFYQYFNILSGTETDNAGPQEFIIDPTPEPGTMVLFATGLLGVVGAGVRTRRRSAKSAS
jgi:hypothetical protein